MLLVLVTVGSAMGLGRAMRQRDATSVSSLAAAATAAPVASAASAPMSATPDARADEAPAVDGEPAVAEAPRRPLPYEAEVVFDEERRVLLVTDAFSREELTVSEWDVSSVIDAGGPTVTLELWGRERLEVPRVVYERLPRQVRYGMDYEATGNLREGDPAPTRDGPPD